MTEDFTKMTTLQLTSAYNGFVSQLETLGCEKFKPIKVFKDKATARERVNALEVVLAKMQHESGKAPETEETEEELQAAIEAKRAEHTVENGAPADGASAQGNPGPGGSGKGRKAGKDPQRALKGAGRTSTVFPSDGVITVLVKENPKREGSDAHARFALYKSKMTVKQARDAGVTREDLKWDSEKGFISIK